MHSREQNYLIQRHRKPDQKYTLIRGNNRSCVAPVIILKCHYKDYMFDRVTKHFNRLTKTSGNRQPVRSEEVSSALTNG